MNPWSNIEISSNDPEIIQIDKLESSLKVLPSNMLQIRELITRFEVCHFKYRQHIGYIKESILNLKPSPSPKKIGANHIRNGANAWKKDKTGRSLLGQEYVWALNKWLGNDPKVKDLYNNKDLGQQIKLWLGEKNSDKERLVRLILARLIWDWKSYEELQHGEEYKELEYQACRMDVCHYCFPGNLDLLLKGIGELEAIEGFEGCGSFNSEIKIYIEEEFSVLMDLLFPMISVNQPDKNNSAKAWLIACLAKTLKEQVGLTQNIKI